MIHIAIDGPGGAGKSTVSRAVAAKLGIVYVDTGALYRTIGLYIKTAGIEPKDTEGVTAALSDITIEIRYLDGRQCVYLNGVDYGDAIRTPEISMYASAVSAIPAVRAFLLDTQRDITEKNSVIMDGRDIGTVILPNAELKIFLTASEECRARRRFDELTAKGQNVKFEDVLAEMTQRDRQDSSRAVAPATAAPDAIILDNTDLDFDGTVDAIIALARKTGLV